MKLTRRTIREYAESLVVAFVLAMIMRHYVVEAFRIPTGSMEPTLMGDEVNGDRILVSKFEYDIHRPEPWDIVVFKVDQYRINYYKQYYQRGILPRDARRHPSGTVEHPGSAEYINYVKRLVGLPGQTVQVRGGDVFIDGHVARRPEAVEKAMLIPVMNNRILKERKQSLADRWTACGPGAALHDGLILLTGSTSEDECKARYTKMGALDPEGEKGYQQIELARVRDRKLAFRLAHTGGAGRLFARLAEDGPEFVLPLGVEGPARLRDGDEVLRESPAPLEPEVEHLIELSDIDGRAVLRVDGDELLRFEREPSGPSRAGSEIVLRAVGCDVTLSDVRLWRDVYYTPAGAQRPADYAVARPFTLGDDEYFVLGDNSSHSFDSRSWGAVKRANLVGEAFFVFWPVSRWKLVR